MRRIGLAIAVVVALLLTLPALAAAEVEVIEAGNGITIRGDAEPNEIRLSVGPSGKIAVNDEETGVTRGEGVVIVVNGNAGRDVIEAPFLGRDDYGSLLVAGGPGDDSIVGGGRGDTFTWANGDNSDEISDVGGTDTLLLSGHPTEADNIFFRPAARPAWVLIGRQATAAVAAFAVETLGVERTSINTLGGNDFTANQGAAGIRDLTELTIHGDVGDDQLGGSNGDDQIDGGPGNDLLAGAAGNDLLFGATGNDRLVGEEGDDRMVWNNGDNNDEDIGGFGNDEVVLSGHPAEPDLLFFKPSEIQFGWVSLQREEVGTVKAFKIELLEVEDFFVDTLGGADIVSQEGPEGIGNLTRLHVQGGPGADRLTGSDGNEEIDGGDGGDQIFARDGKADLVVGGPGNDEAFTDALSLDDVREVETVDAAPAEPGPEGPGPEEPPDPGPKQPDPETPPTPERPVAPVPDRVALLPSLGKLSLGARAGSPVATVPLTCPATEAGGCRATVTIETAKAVRLAGRKAVLRLGAAKAELGPGATAVLKVRLNRRAAALLQRGKLPVRVRIASTDAVGNTTSSSLTRVLKPR